MSDEAGAFDLAFDAAQQRNDAERKMMLSTIADEMEELTRLESILLADELMPRDRRLISQRVHCLRMKYGFEEAAQCAFT